MLATAHQAAGVHLAAQSFDFGTRRAIQHDDIAVGYFFVQDHLSIRFIGLVSSVRKINYSSTITEEIFRTAGPIV